MTALLPRRRVLVGLTIVYLFAGFTFTDVGPLELYGREDGCPAHLLERTDAERRESALTVLQGNFWMLPERPLLIPFAFSTDRRERLERLVRLVRACRPNVIALQEVYELAMVDRLRESLPEYQVLLSGGLDPTGTINTSGLVTLTTARVNTARFYPFAPLGVGAQPIERLGRKGVLVVDLDADGYRGTVMNLHLYASRSAKESSFALAQLGEVVDHVRHAGSAGRRVVIAGDFNLTREELETSLPGRWILSEHGPTYDPVANAYAVQGANNTRAQHANRRYGQGTRTIDFLMAPLASGVHVTSDVLTEVMLSDHWFLQHVITESE